MNQLIEISECHFIHVAKPNFTATKGCVALKKNNLIKLIKRLKYKGKDILKSITKD